MFKNQLKFQTYSFPIFFIVLIFFLMSIGFFINDGYSRGKCSVSTKALSKLDTRKGDRASADALNKQGLGKHKSRDYCEAINLWTEAAKVDPSWWKPFFNIACAAALSGDTETSFKFIDLAMQRDYRRVFNSVKSDSDLKSIRGTDEYSKFITAYNNTQGRFWCNNETTEAVFKEGNYVESIFTDSKGKNLYITQGHDPAFPGTEGLKKYYFITGKTYRICFKLVNAGDPVGIGSFIVDAKLIK